MEKKLSGAQVFAVLKELYSHEIVFLYKAIMVHKPEFNWLFASGGSGKST